MVAEILDSLKKDYQLLLKNEGDKIRVTVKKLKTIETKSSLIKRDNTYSSLNVLETVEKLIERLKESEVK